MCTTWKFASNGNKNGNDFIADLCKEQSNLLYPKNVRTLSAADVCLYFLNDDWSFEGALN